MIDRLLRVLDAAARSPDQTDVPDATEVADALWLAERIPALPGRRGLGMQDRPRDFAASHELAAPGPEQPRAGLHLTPPQPRTGHEAAARADPGAEPQTAPDSADDDGPRPAGTLAGVPSVPAIRSVAAITRALRPLRMRVDARTLSVVDEDATAQRIADTGLWLPELLPGPERRLDLVLITDESASMVVWRRTVAEFCELLTRLGAFRDIRVVPVDTDQPVTAARLTAPIPRPAPPRQRLVLVLSDCVGRAWTEGGMLLALEAIGPAAIVQLLPQRLWTGIGLPFFPVRFTGNLLTTLCAEPRDGGGLPGAEGLPIPVLELDARWLGPWANALAGSAAEPFAGMAVYTRTAPVHVPRHDPARGYDRVSVFGSTASPGAIRLAAYLAAAPLSLPVMRLVQYVMMPLSRPADLAEVFLSGLFKRVASPGQGMVEFEFFPGVRELLLGSLRRAEALRVLRLVSEYIGERLGSGPEFAAVFTAGGGTRQAAGVRGPLTDPFAVLARTVLRSVGGQYREIADKLDPAWAPASAKTEIPVFPSAGLSASGSRVRTISKGGRTVSETAEAGPPALWRGVPSRNPNFTGRDDLLLALRSQLSEGITALVPIALHGLGGVGKTQVAIEYAYRFQANYDLICWISGEVPLQLRSDLAALAPDLGLPTGGDLELTLAAVCDALRRGKPFRRWLLVVDNAEAPAELLPMLPQSGGHILITSRNRTWGGYASTFQVAEFTRDESISLIQRRGHDISAADADRLAERLGDLPIAVEQAAAWQAESGMSVRRYLELLEEQMSVLLEENPPRDYPKSVVAAWTLAFEDLRQHSPEGAALVQLCSFLGPEPIPYTLLWSFRHAPDLPPDLSETLSDDVHFHRAVRQVGQRALLKVDPGKETLTEHRLVQAVLRERLSPREQAEMASLVHRLLIVANPGRPDDRRNWETLAVINRHLRPSGIIDADDRAARSVVIDQIRFLFNRGDHRSSRELAEEVVDKWRHSPGPSDEQTLIACRLLGIVLRELGLTEQAREINEDTLEKCREAFGPEHEHTLVIANSYAADLRISGLSAEALALDKDLLPLHRVVFGENDEATFRSAHNLAIDMRLSGDYRSAYEQDMDTLRRRRAVLGDDRWETWSSAGAVGKDLRGLGEFGESARYLAEAIPACTRLLSAEHPEVIRMKMDYAATLRRLGRFTESRDIAEACVELNLRRLGGHHNYTLVVMTTLAEVLRLIGHADRALELADQVAAAAPATYHSGVALIATCRHNYAIKLRSVGQYDQAYSLDRDVNERFHSVLGDSRRRTVSSDMSLARDLELRGDSEAAISLFRRVVDVSGQIRGEEHPRTLFCAVNLATALRDAGEAAEAGTILDRALPALRDQLGAGHPEVMLAESGAFIELEMELPDR